MKQFEPGMFARFPNEQIPRILDILKANGYNVYESDANYQDGMNVVLCSSDGDFIGYWSKRFVDKKTELSKHDFLVIALRLKHGEGIDAKTSTKCQMNHIVKTITGLSIDTAGLPDFYLKHDFHQDSNLDGFVFTHNNHFELWEFSTNEGAVSYIEWCRRLCVEPIECNGNCSNYCDNNGCVERKRVLTEPIHAAVEKTLEQHVDEYDAGKFDPMKPFEVKAKSSEHWNRYEDWRYVSFDEVRKVHIFYCESSHGYVAADCVRNIEFTAAMLEVGEFMSIQYEGLPYGIVKKVAEDRCIEIIHGVNFIDKNLLHTVKGRKVPVEIKIVEI